jgi:hypothetical protein
MAWCRRLYFELKCSFVCKFNNPGGEGKGNRMVAALPPLTIRVTGDIHTE